MKTAIIYYSKHGTTERVAYLIGESLNHKVDYISLRERAKPDIRTYDRIILGTSIYAGTPSRIVTEFCKRNRLLLEQKVIGLFICCMKKLAIPKAILGGEFLFDKMNCIERFITRKIAKIESSVSCLRYNAIREFATQTKDSYLG